MVRGGIAPSLDLGPKRGSRSGSLTDETASFDMARTAAVARFVRCTKHKSRPTIEAARVT